MSLAKFLKEARVNAKMSTRLAAERIGISASYLNALENGNAIKIKMKYIANMASIYGVDMDELCIFFERVPQDIYYKLIRCPQLFEVVRQHPE